MFNFFFYGFLGLADDKRLGNLGETSVCDIEHLFNYGDIVLVDPYD